MTHPDLDHLSALVDGIDDDATAEHVTTCDTCATTLAGLRSASRAVADPVPLPPPEDRDRAVRAALAAAFADDADARAVVPLRARPRRRPPSWVLAAAAAVLVAALAVPLVSGLAGSGRSAKSSTASSGTATAGPASREQQSAGSAGATAGTPDLGAVDDPATLRARLGGVSVSATAGFGAADSTQPAAGAVSGSLPATTQPAPSSAPAPPAAPRPDPCVAGAAASFGASSAQLRLVASLVWRGTPATVYVFARPGGPTVAIVVARDGCRALDTVTL